MKTIKICMLCVIALGGGRGLAAANEVAVRNLKWTYAGEAFESPRPAYESPARLT